MVVKAINTAAIESAKNRRQNNNQKNNNTLSFQGSFNPIVTLMDSIDRGGFAASFILQDGFGMVAPRIKEGLNRGREVDENGKKHGPYNWEFARKEGIREILSGPSAFIIPAIMLHFIKKHSGTANNVSIDMIKGLGQHFEEFAQNNSSIINDTAQTKKLFYNKIFENIIQTSTQEIMPDGAIKNTLSDKQVKQLAEEFTAKTIEIENAKSKGFFKKFIGKEVKGSAEDLTENLTDRFMLLRKENLSPSVNEMTASLTASGREKPLQKTFGKMIESMKDFTDDAISSAQKRLSKHPDTNIGEYISKWVSHRTGSRFVSNMSMFLAVVGFYALIPKIYNLGLKHNPAIKDGESDTNTTKPAANTATTEKTNNTAQTEKNGQNVAFQGAGLQKAIGKAGDVVSNSSWLKKLSDKFEFNGPQMPESAMLTLLFGFCLPARYVNRQDEYDGKEILVRDIASFSAILFAAEALKRGCSDMFAKITGLALNTKPEDHNKTFLHKLKNYFTPAGGVNVLKSEAIISKYSNIDKYKDGINGFFEFIENNGGNIRKVLRLDKTVKANAEAIVGKPLKQASIDEIKTAFKNVKNTDALNNIYNVFKNKSNKYVNIAKTSNSTFGFLSTLVLVPSFMIWLARYCDKMTKRDRARDKAEKATAEQNQTQIQASQTQQNQVQQGQKINTIVAQPTMAGFLNN